MDDAEFFAATGRHFPGYEEKSENTLENGGKSGTIMAMNNYNGQLRVDVLAPSDTLWIDLDGNMLIGPEPTLNTGEWKLFRGRESS